MKRLTLTNKTTYSLNESEVSGLQQAIDKGSKYVVLQGDMLMVASIVAVQDEDKFVELDHTKNGEYECQHSFWHMRGDKCYGHDAMEVSARNRLKEFNVNVSRERLQANYRGAE